MPGLVAVEPVQSFAPEPRGRIPVSISYPGPSGSFALLVLRSVFHSASRRSGRLRLSLEAADRLGGLKIAMMHYPPLPVDGAETPMSALLSAHHAAWTVYGHLHGASRRLAQEGPRGGVEYRLVSADHVGFRPQKIFE